MRQVLFIISLLGLAACTSGGGSGSGGGGSISPIASPTPLPTPDVSPTPEPSPTPVVCAPFMGTDWVADGLPTLTEFSADQPGLYIAEFDMTVADPVFTEVQYISGLGNISCLRHFNAGAGPLDNMTWADTTGSCVSVANWLQIDGSQCNELTVLIRDGIGNIYETQKYKIAP